VERVPEIARRPTAGIATPRAEYLTRVGGVVALRLHSCGGPHVVGRKMGRQAAVVLYVLALVAVVVGVDVLFFRNRFWERLMVNVGIVVTDGTRLPMVSPMPWRHQRECGKKGPRLR
jgi:hypothetical protein